MSIAGIVAALFPEHDPHDGPRAPDGWESFREACEALGSPRFGTWDAHAKGRLGQAFRKHKGRLRPAGRLDVARDADGNPLNIHGSAAWTVTKPGR